VRLSKPNLERKTLVFSQQNLLCQREAIILHDDRARYVGCGLDLLLLQ